jgi:hypothetical protein
MSPFRIAFIDEDSEVWKVINWSIDIIFGIDIIVIFNTAYLDVDFMLIHDRSVLATNYLKGWFSIDIIAILPFEIVMGEGNN